MKTPEDAIAFEREEERREAIEHRDVLLAIGVILKSKEGISLFEYLFKYLDVACVPEQDMEGKVLYDYLGFLRAGNSIYKLVCEADFEISASILSHIERKKYDNLRRQHNFYSDDSNS